MVWHERKSTTDLNYWCFFIARAFSAGTFFILSLKRMLHSHIWKCSSTLCYLKSNHGVSVRYYEEEPNLRFLLSWYFLPISLFKNLIKNVHCAHYWKTVKSLGWSTKLFKLVFLKWQASTSGFKNHKNIKKSNPLWLDSLLRNSFLIALAQVRNYCLQTLYFSSHVKKIFSAWKVYVLSYAGLL